MDFPAPLAGLPTPTMASPETAKRTRSGRSAFLKWLRKLHGWIGLWGAALGLLFGMTGVLLNHRASMPIKLPFPPVATVQLPLPAPSPASAHELAQYLQTALKLARPAQRIANEPAHPVTWGDRTVMQPERWSVRFLTPAVLVEAQMWKGDAYVSVVRRDQGLIGTLMGLHRSQGAGIGWILLADSIAGSIVLLSITGVLLWTEMNRRKTAGAAIFIVSIMAMIVLAAGSI
jgi:hypothetical protein